MSILPHTNPDAALQLVLGLDIPFWPQLPNIGFADDMYAQALYDFPGISINHEESKISFDNTRFFEQLGDYSARMETDNDTFTLASPYGDLYHRFLKADLSGHAAIHGQMAGPVNLGFRVQDETGRPLIYDDSIRAMLFDFVKRKYDAQLAEMRAVNRQAFVWLDEPGMIWVFSGLSGYNDIKAREEYGVFLKGMDGLKALHLCTNINLPYLLELGVGLLSFDAYQLEVMPKSYAGSVAEFIRAGGIISWGIVPTDPALANQETPESLTERLLGYWQVVADEAGLPVPQVARQALLAPAKCCVKSLEFAAVNSEISCGSNTESTTEEQSVASAYEKLKAVSAKLRGRFGF